MEIPVIPFFSRGLGLGYFAPPPRILSPRDGVRYFTLRDWYPPVPEARISLQPKPLIYFPVA